MRSVGRLSSERAGRIEEVAELADRRVAEMVYDGLVRFGGLAGTPTGERRAAEDGLLVRIAVPTVFVSLQFIGAYVMAEFYLHRQQSASVRNLIEAISSCQIAGDPRRGRLDQSQRCEVGGPSETSGSRSLL